MQTPNHAITLIDRWDNARSIEAIDIAYASIVDYAFDGVTPDTSDFASWVELTRAQNEREAREFEGRVMTLVPVAGYVLADGRPDYWAEIAVETAALANGSA